MSSSLRLGSNFAVFLLFFGLSLLEAFQAGNWLRAAFWLAIATVFLYADQKRDEEQRRDTHSTKSPIIDRRG